MAEAIQDTPAWEFVLDLQADGKLSFGAVEHIEKIRPLGLTKPKVGRAARKAGRLAQRIG